MKTTPNRAARRRAAQFEAREDKKRNRRWRTSAAALGVAAGVGMGMAGGAGTALADDTPPASALDGLSPEMILDLLDDEMITGFVEMCRTGALANGNPDASQSTDWNPEDTTTGTLPPGAIATCTDSTGHGLALVLPDRFEIGQLGNDMVIDLGPDQIVDAFITTVRLPMGNQNLFNLISGQLFDGPRVLGLVKVRDEAIKRYGLSIDPQTFGKYGDYETDIYSRIQRDANAPVVKYTTDKCVTEHGSDGPVTDPGGWFSTCSGNTTKVSRNTDVNLGRRTDALKVASHLTGQKYTDYTQPVTLPPLTGPKGQSVIKGDGINVALSMRDGRAFAETGNNLSIAFVGADKGKLAAAYAKWAIAIAANMDTEDIRFTWFGQDVDFSELLPLLQSEMAKEALGEGGDMTPMLELIEGLNGQIPSIKEVFCFGVNAQTTAEGLGSCSNYLGTFDTYKDLRALTDGSADFTGDRVSRQAQYGLTDASSLLFGNDALIKHLGPLLGGDADMGSLLSNPVVVDMLAAVLSEDKRIKLTKDFIRYTKNVETVFEKEQATDADGNLLWDDVYVYVPKLDDEGNEILDEDGKVVTERVKKQVQATDDDGNLLWLDDEQTQPKLVDDKTPRMKNKVTPRMVAAFEDAWEDYVSDEPVMVDAEDENGDPIWIDDEGNVVDEGTDGAVKKQVQKVEDGEPVFKTKTRYLKKPVMVQQEVGGEKVWRDATDADDDYVWFDAEGNELDDVDEDDLPEGAVKKAPVLVQKMEQATDSQGNPLWDPVVAKSTTAHWLTSDYGLREPLVIQWGSHEVVFFPAVEVNGTYRPNLIGMPEIRKIADGADVGLLPKISLVQWDNPFGLGTLSLDKPFDIFGTARDFKKSITLDDDLKRLDKLLYGGDKRLTAEIGDGLKDFVSKPFQDLNDLLKPKPKDDAPVVDPEDGAESEGDVGTDVGEVGTGSEPENDAAGDTGLDSDPEVSEATSAPEPEVTTGVGDPSPSQDPAPDLTGSSPTQSSTPQAAETSAPESTTSADSSDALEPALG